VVIPSELEIGTLSTAEAESIRFYSDASLTTELPREVVSEDEIHVKVSSVSSSTEIWADYDGVRADYAVTATYGAEAVWSDYEFLSHDGGGTDSTGNHSPSPGGSVTAGGATGKIGDATDYDGIDDYFDLGSSVLFGANVTVQYWTKTPSSSGVESVQTTKDSSTRRFTVFHRQDASPKKIQAYIRDQSGSADYSGYFDEDIYNDAWHKVEWTIDDSAEIIYAYTDGTLVNSIGIESGESWGGFTPNQATYIGGEVEFNRRYYDGLFDEYRIRNSYLDSNWRTTEYNNQNDNAAFWVATEEVTVTASPIAHILQMI